MESTTNLIHNGAGNYYFRSSDIRIFPSAFRGTYEAITEQGNTLNLTFDPEARLNTEANFILPDLKLLLLITFLTLSNLVNSLKQ